MVPARWLSPLLPVLALCLAACGGSPFAGTYSGTYSGPDWGSLAMTVDATGGITLSATSFFTHSVYTGVGHVDPLGQETADGDGAGSGVGFTFSGKFVQGAPDTASGTWTATNGASGSWSVTGQ